MTLTYLSLLHQGPMFYVLRHAYVATCLVIRNSIWLKFHTLKFPGNFNEISGADLRIPHSRTHRLLFSEYILISNFVPKDIGKYPTFFSATKH